ncbi:MAG: DUF4476 domain-containing protein [Bacteroidales bacterium]|nr:DUF4476 domain-containing protein [Bacteroidales bacterium]
MRSFISTAILCLLVLAGIAQNNDFVFYTDNGDKFTLYLNNAKQNSTAATNVKAENINGKTISVKVVFERSGVPTLNRSMSVSSNDKEIKVQLVKGRENVYSMKTVSTTDRQHNNQSNGNSGYQGSTATKDNGHGNNNGGYGNNNGHDNNGHGNNGGNHGNGGHGNNGHNNGGHGNGGHGNGGHGNGGYWNNNGYGPSDNPRCNRPMPQNDFNSLRSQVRARYFDSSRLTVAKQACRYNCMTSDQIRDLCKEFSYESNRLDFAKYAFEYCYDRYRYYIVGQSFTYSSSVDDLNRYITNQMAAYQNPYGGYNNGGYNNGGYQGGYGYFQSDNPNCHYIMTEQDFNDLCNMINNTPYSSTKMTIAKQACSFTCISAEQVREICRLFSFDSDRLTFAKYAYEHCYDRRNYFKVNDVFTFTSSVNELNRFINQQNH